MPSSLTEHHRGGEVMEQARSYVVTGGSNGVGRTIAQQLARVGHVIVLDVAAGPAWDDDRVHVVQGDAGDPDTARAAADEAESRAPLVGWVNNAAIFRDASLTGAGAHEVADLIAANLNLAVVGCHAAVNHFVDHGRGGSIVNVSSHQAQRPVRGALPYATAKAAVEGLTRAVAVDHGPDGIRANAVALGSITTPRYEEYRAAHPDVDAQMAAIHPLGGVGRPIDVATAVEFLLSEDARYITGAILPIDGGRSVLGPDPEAT
jgi:NAD(P)-dependent dehydrogenase (short-subunit alcohol dehydrogenase family)